MNNQTYITTNIRLPKDHLWALKRQALEEEKSVSLLLRELVAERLGKGNPVRKSIRQKRSIWDLPKFAKRTGRKTLSGEVDEIVYGKP